jgi:[acyl-carrier-protein] S-malonyltransferase
MAVSLAAMRVLEIDFGIGCKAALFAAGHSLGEYSAHAAAGTFSLRDTAKLLKLRGQAMQKAVPAGIGGMAALMGPKADLDLAEAACAKGAHLGVVVVANDNNAGQIVISGEMPALLAATEEAKLLGAKAAMLNVSAPFHCPLMAPAADAMREALNEVTIAQPMTAIVANVTARPIVSIAEIADLLVAQVTGRVRWRESAQWLAKEGGVDHFVEVGQGKVLTGMLKRLCPEAQSLSLNGASDFESFATLFNQGV